MCTTHSRIINDITINYDLVSDPVISSFCNLAAINYNFINAVSWARARARAGKVIDTIIIVQLADASVLLLPPTFFSLALSLGANSPLIVHDSYLTTGVCWYVRSVWFSRELPAITKFYSFRLLMGM